MKYNLKFFNANTDAGQDNAAADTDGNAASDNNNGGAEDSAEDNAGDDADGKGDKTLTMTQKEIDAMVAGRLARERAKMPKKEELKAFKDWQDNQKTESEKMAEKMKELQEKTAEAENLRREAAALKKGVTPDNVDFAIFQASKITSDDLDFDAALDKVLTEKKFLLNAIQAQSATGMKQTKQAPDGADDALKKKIFADMGVKM